MLTRKALDVLGENAVKRIFFELPVRVEVSPGEIKGVKLTVYEESDPERLGQLFAERYCRAQKYCQYSCFDFVTL
eukprot:COSAG05_NODE_2347_length_3196_cov_4.919277_4_plen_75_part_00